MKGAWMIYDWDNGYRLERISTELQPLVREVAQRGYGKVGWLPLDTDLQDAAKAWESQDPMEIPSLKVGWKDPAPQTNEEVYESLTEMVRAIGVELNDWQNRAVRYFLNDTVGEKSPSCDTCGDSGRVPWMAEGDPNMYQEPDGDGMIPCPDHPKDPE